MGGSIYKVIELVGSSQKSWEDAIKSLVESSAKHLKEIRIVEVKKMDVKVEDGKVVLFRVRVELSFRYTGK